MAPHGGSKMSTVKKKQDDRNLKILREQAALACNKQCFDCYQRGPTYIDMTIGSFVCTSCSGLLRGLNPPHRVKSISMATFTADEIEFVKSRGNEVGSISVCSLRPVPPRRPAELSCNSLCRAKLLSALPGRRSFN
ncbi:ArfGap domain containing protein [Trichuris trichiura]|uniref:ArfGap domain containing protein n=1 Tax=Trichuris trichiura TaxID=36087 RepID=A0A077YXM3_TRITR|nr:ArfGap domain containing protein [Trichuris trichiura]